MNATRCRLCAYIGAVKETNQMTLLGCTPRLRVDVLLAGSLTSWVVQLLIPVAWTSLRRQVEQVPERLEGADVTGILARV